MFQTNQMKQANGKYQISQLSTDRTVLLAITVALLFYKFVWSTDWSFVFFCSRTDFGNIGVQKLLHSVWVRDADFIFCDADKVPCQLG